MVLPGPRQRLADCIWLPRLLAKARLLLAGKLPPEYAARVGAVDGVDGAFLSHFALAKEEIIAVAERPDNAVAAWFSSRPQSTPERISEWNHLALNLGRPGFPLEARLPRGLATTYAHIAHLKPDNVFAMLEADEGIPPPV